MSIAENPPHDQLDHICTEQETALYDAMTAGDWTTVDQTVDDAKHDDQQPPTHPPPDGWRPPAQVVDEDYANAHAHYQADHEAPEAERVENTAEQVEAENVAAEVV